MADGSEMALKKGIIPPRLLDAPDFDGVAGNLQEVLIGGFVSSYSGRGAAIGFVVGLFENLSNRPFANLSSSRATGTLLQEGLQLCQLLSVAIVRKSAPQQIVLQGHPQQSGERLQALVLFFSNVDGNAAHILASMILDPRLPLCQPHLRKMLIMWVLIRIAGAPREQSP
jgi:hypothetical protein